MLWHRFFTWNKKENTQHTTPTDTETQEESLAKYMAYAKEKSNIISGTEYNTGGYIIGILHSRDYLLKYNRPDFKLENVIVPPTLVPTAAHLDSLFKDMQKEHKHIVVVIDEYGETAGIVTMEDILEEIVGEIWDERDEEIETFVKISNDTYRVICSANIEDFFEFFEIEPTEETEAVTVNGWIIELIGSIPEKDYSFEYSNLSITVSNADEFMALEMIVKVNEKSEE